MPVETANAELPELPSSERLQELLFAAARMGRDDVLPALFQAGADIEGTDPKGYTALILASYNGQESTTALLLSYGARVDAGDTERGNTALMGIAFKGYTAIAKLLIDRGADVNARNFAGQTALMTAAMFNRIEIIDLLLAAGADPTLSDASGNTVTNLARSQGNHALVEQFTSR
ncbi:MAG: ankyrin repeat domain-containing protein [Aliidongia sp.]